MVLLQTLHTQTVHLGPPEHNLAWNAEVEQTGPFSHQECGWNLENGLGEGRYARPEDRRARATGAG